MYLQDLLENAALLFPVMEQLSVDYVMALFCITFHLLYLVERGLENRLVHLSPIVYLTVYSMR